jgi:hypothetical protein
MTTDKSSVAPQPDPFQEAFRRRFSEHLAADVAGGKAALDTAQKAGREFGGVELHPERLGAFGDALAERAPQLARDFGREARGLVDGPREDLKRLGRIFDPNLSPCERGEIVADFAYGMAREVAVDLAVHAVTEVVGGLKDRGGRSETGEISADRTPRDWRALRDEHAVAPRDVPADRPPQETAATPLFDVRPHRP